MSLKPLLTQLQPHCNCSACTALFCFRENYCVSEAASHHALAGPGKSKNKCSCTEPPKARREASCLVRPQITPFHRCSLNSGSSLGKENCTCRVAERPGQCLAQARGVGLRCSCTRHTSGTRPLEDEVPRPGPAAEATRPRAPKIEA